LRIGLPLTPPPRRVLDPPGAAEGPPAHDRRAAAGGLRAAQDPGRADRAAGRSQCGHAGLSYLIEEVAKKIIITQATGEYLLRQDTLVRRDALLAWSSSTTASSAP